MSSVQSPQDPVVHASAVSPYPPAASRGRPGRIHPAGSLAMALATLYPSMGAAEPAPVPVLPEVNVSADSETPSGYTPPPPASPRFTQPLLDTAQTVTVVPQAVIKERGATTLRDVLRNVTGISMQAGEGGTPAGDQLSVRGFSARTDIFVDNVRDFGGYTRDPFNIEQVEVVKGPSSDYSGRGSTGGSINLVSKTPFLDDFTAADVTLGSDAYRRTTVDVNHTLPGLDTAAVRVNLMYHDQDIAGRDVVENQRFGIAPSLSFGLGTPTEITFSLFHMEQDNVPDYGIPWVPMANATGPLAGKGDKPGPVDYANWYGLKDRDHEDVRTTIGTAIFDYTFNDTVKLRNLTRWGETERDSIITAPRFDGLSNTMIRRSDWKSRDQVDSIVSNVTDVTLNFDTGTVRHTVLVGVEGALEKEKLHTRLATGPDSPSTPLESPNPDDPYLENIQRTGGAAKTDARTVAGYISESMELNRFWELNGGLRLDRFDVEFDPDGAPSQDRVDTLWSYRGGIVFKPARRGSIYLGYGTSFNPTVEGFTVSSSVNNLGLADLEPEKNRSYELGTKWEVLSGRMFLTAALFRTDKTNARTQDPDDPTDLVVLEGEQRVQGVELGMAGNVTDAWAVFAGYTYLDSEIRKSNAPTEIGNDLPNAPRHTFNLWTTYAVAPTVDVGFGASYADERFNSTNNLRTAPDYWVYEAMVGWRVSDTFSMRLNLQNLTDEKYIDYVGGGHFIPGTGRTVLLTSSVAF